MLAATEKRSLVINDAHRDSRVRREIIETYGIHAILDVALTIGDDLVGDFALHHHVPGKTFDEFTVDFVNKVASSLTLALKNARLYEERRKILDVLRESEERFRSAFAYAAFGMLLTGIDGRILQVNRSLCRMLGYPEPELLKKTFLELTHPEDLEASMDLMNDLVTGQAGFRRSGKEIPSPGRECDLGPAERFGDTGSPGKTAVFRVAGAGRDRPEAVGGGLATRSPYREPVAEGHGGHQQLPYV